MRVENGNLIRSKRHLFPCFITVLYLLQVGRGWERRVFYWWWVPDFGGGGGERGLFKNVNFQECNTHGKGRRFRIALYASLPIVRKVDSSIHWMNLYPLDSAIHLLNNRGLINKGLLIRPKKKTFSCGPTREVPNEQDEFILPAGVANQNTFFASSCPLMNSAI